MSICQCWCGCGGCSKPVPFFEGFPLHFRSSPARFSTRHTLAGLTATMSASSIMNASPPIALQRILQMERNDRLLLPILQPKVPGNPAVMLVDPAVALAPAVELAGRDVELSDDPPGADLGLLRPAPDEIHDLVPRI